ncbi:right-handed parallel beta-helix repeat-containing protein [Hymenobacter sp. H14-R3]|uniref:right-handed parallel beta-helix repeat-containing protein n=1 Tax=Hymenobacter sp. H14-R3 TaxID=3046308 RepID=UPI0024BB8C9F|nr:right-handed parallel beta-helix repeat-containing protein [Hymenobacter sp. H14-R3]MDJ0365489.1 right-handed parallel beta-helix repeat-containing protein [Hymenobacter sp. H14-R3]
MLSTTLPAITHAATAIDGTTQTILFDSNTAVLGTGGTVGTAATALNQLSGPEVELSIANADVLTIAADNCVVRGLVLHGGGGNNSMLRANSGVNLLLEQCGIGITAFGITTPAANPTNGVGVVLSNLSGTVRNSLIMNCGSSGINYSGSAEAGSGYTITGNEFQQNGRITAGGDNITLGDQSAGATGPVTISNNLIANANSSGIQLEIGHLSNNSITGNTITNNGKGGPATRLEGSGMHYLQRSNPATKLVLSTNTDVISNNIIATNQSSAVVINYGQRNVRVTQNSIYGNGDGTTGGQGLIAIDYTPITYYVGGNSAYGQGDGVTPNDGTVNANKANGGMNYPIITSKNVKTSGLYTTLHVEGFVGKFANQSRFANTEVEFYRGDNTTDTNQNGEITAGDGQSFPHGEPSTYIGTLTTDKTGSFAADITVLTASISPALLTTDPINSLAYKAEYGTSEAGINLIPNTIPPNLLPLPVTLTRFDAQASGVDVLLTWATATELNNEYFEVQRSFNGRDFEALSKVDGHGTTTKAQGYSYTDVVARAASLLYYRLRQVDTDGKDTYSPLRVVRLAAQAMHQPAYPNPTADYTSLDLSTLSSGEYQLVVTDLLGKIVATQPAQGGRVATLDLHALAAGTYLVRLAGNATLKWQVAHY